MAIYYESSFVSLHYLTGISAELYAERYPCPREPSWSGQALSTSGEVTQILRGLPPWGSERAVGSEQSPGSAQELANSGHMSHRLLQRGRCSQEWSQRCSQPGWYLSEPKEGKKDGASYSTYRPYHHPCKTSTPFTC